MKLNLTSKHYVGIGLAAFLVSLLYYVYLLWFHSQRDFNESLHSQDQGGQPVSNKTDKTSASHSSTVKTTAVNKTVSAGPTEKSRNGTNGILSTTAFIISTVPVGSDNKATVDSTTSEKYQTVSGNTTGLNNVFPATTLGSGNKIVESPNNTTKEMRKEAEMSMPPPRLKESVSQIKPTIIKAESSLGSTVISPASATKSLSTPSTATATESGSKVSPGGGASPSTTATRKISSSGSSSKQEAEMSIPPPRPKEPVSQIKPTIIKAESTSLGSNVFGPASATKSFSTPSTATATESGSKVSPGGGASPSTTTTRQIASSGSSSKQTSADKDNPESIPSASVKFTLKKSFIGLIVFVTLLLLLTYMFWKCHRRKSGKDLRKKYIEDIKHESGSSKSLLNGGDSDESDEEVIFVAHGKQAHSKRVTLKKTHWQ